MPRRKVRSVMLTLKSRDGHYFRVQQKAALVSGTIRSLDEVNLSSSAPIPIDEATGDILDKVLEYCEEHAAPRGGRMKNKVTLDRWDARFIQSVDQNVLHGLLVAGNYLSIDGLVNLAIARVVQLMRGRAPEEIRQMLNIRDQAS